MRKVGSRAEMIGTTRSRVSLFMINFAFGASLTTAATWNSQLIECGTVRATITAAGGRYTSKQKTASVAF